MISEHNTNTCTEICQCWIYEIVKTNKSNNNNNKYNERVCRPPGTTQYIYQVFLHRSTAENEYYGQFWAVLSILTKIIHRKKLNKRN